MSRCNFPDFIMRLNNYIIKKELQTRCSDQWQGKFNYHNTFFPNQDLKGATCSSTTCHKSSVMLSSPRCSCHSATSSVPRSMWTAPPVRASALVSDNYFLSRKQTKTNPVQKVIKSCNITLWQSSLHTNHSIGILEGNWMVTSEVD